MKTLNIQLLFAALLISLCLMTSCKKENDRLMESDLSGVWNVEKGSVAISDGEDINDFYEFEAAGTLTLEADGTGQDDFEIIIDNNKEFLSESYTWELNGSTLKIETVSDVFEWQVQEVKGGFDIWQREPMDGRPEIMTKLTLMLRS